MDYNLGHAKWDVEALKKVIDLRLKDTLICQPDSEGRVEFSIQTLSDGSDGVYQPKYLFEAFNMETPKDWLEDHPDEEYDPVEDEFVWDDIDRIADEDATSIRTQLVLDGVFTLKMRDLADEWGVYFGNREADGDYCLFLWYKVKE